MERKFNIGDTVKLKIGKRNRFHLLNGCTGVIRNYYLYPIPIEYEILITKDNGEKDFVVFNGHYLELIKNQNKLEK